ncbi:HNH endonuclease [Shewanella sp. SG44-6]|jgi:hypothetical protein|uniref:HNH endonuclease n=1 Tax=Shewanella sp. SG44-6 TaxID=2760959 RepID=UPI001604508B|nr:HNH endonuclease [Shewanella sp. SG44-6]MBB1391682.1 HNH endonuclease [Shewanella sp. SG44-6]
MYHWVNQTNNFEKEFNDGRITSDLKSSSPNYARMNVLKIMKGDVIFSFNKKSFQAILIATGNPVYNKLTSKCIVKCRYILNEEAIPISEVYDALDATNNPFIQPSEYSVGSPLRLENGIVKKNMGYAFPIGNGPARILSKLARFEESASANIDIPVAGNPKRKEVTINRILRDTAVTRKVKSLYDHKCQVCGIQFITPNGAYSEGAHIIPLGGEHQGPDKISNLLCLCPNHHVMLDYFMFSIRPDMTLIGLNTELIIHKGHKLSLDSLKWHRAAYKRAQNKIK